MSWELQLLSHIITNKNFNDLETKGVTVDTFQSIEGRLVYDFIHRWNIDPDSYGDIPGWDLIKEKFPNIEFSEPTQSFETLCQLVVDNRLSVELDATIAEAATMTKDTPKKAMDFLRSKLMLIENKFTGPSEDIDVMATASDTIIRNYFMTKEKGLQGIPWPWPYLNDATEGILPGKIITIYGETKKFKTWIMLYIIVSAYLTTMKKVLIMSLDMPWDELQERSVCMVGHIDWDRYTKRKLTKEEEHRLKAIPLNLAEEEAFNPNQRLIIAKRPRTRKYMDWVMRKIDQLKPDIVGLDAIYKISKRQDPTSLSETIHAIQDYFQTIRIPCVATWQENPRAAIQYGRKGTASAAFSQSILQDCDFAMHVIPDEDAETGEAESVGIMWPATRRYRHIKDFTIYARPAYNFEFKNYGIKSDAIRKNGKPETEIDDAIQQWEKKSKRD